jgi:hypothetical protein
MNNDKNTEEFRLVIFGLYYDVVERLRTLDRNIAHIYNLIHYLYDCYEEYYCHNSNHNDFCEDSNIFRPYKKVVELIVDDIRELKKILKKIKVEMISEYSNVFSNSTFKICGSDAYKLTEDYLKIVLFRGFPLKNNENREYSKIYKKWVREKIYKEIWKKEAPSSVSEFLLDVRELIEYENAPHIQISIGSMLKSFSYLTHSLYQSLGGLHVGNVIEHEPSIYPHKDICHVMEFGSLYYCKGYQQFWTSLLKESVKKIKNNSDIYNEFCELFYNISKIDLKNNDEDSSLDYTIVFGDSPLPFVIDRYKLIRLPLTCAYRPRYWSALAHEVSHSFISSLLYFKKILDDYSMFNDDEGQMANEIIKYIQQKKLGSGYNYISYMYEIIDYISKKLTQNSWYTESVGLVIDNEDEEFQFKLAHVSELVADVFGFLLSGYAYIPALIANTALGKSYRMNQQKPPYLLRLGIIMGIAKEFCRDIENEKDNNLIEDCENTYINNEIIEKFKKLLEEKNNTSCNKIESFLMAFEIILTDDLIPSTEFKTSHYYYALGKDLGTDLYNRVLKEFIDGIIEDGGNKDKNNEIPYFGWFKYKPKMADELIKRYSENKKVNELINLEGYVLFNIILNNACIRRINGIFDMKEELGIKHVSRLCESIETIELFKQMKEIKWYILKKKKRC